MRVVFGQERRCAELDRVQRALGQGLDEAMQTVEKRSPAADEVGRDWRELEEQRSGLLPESLEHRFDDVFDGISDVEEAWVGIPDAVAVRVER